MIELGALGDAGNSTFPGSNEKAEILAWRKTGTDCLQAGLFLGTG